MRVRSIRALALLVSIAALLILPSDGAADATGGYLMLKGGVFAPTASQSVNQIGNLGTFPTSGDFDLALGTMFGLLGLQLDAGYLWTSSSGVKVSGYPVSAVLQLRFPILFVVPYIEAGLGVFIATASFSDGSSGSSSKAAFMAPLGGGVDLLLGPLIVGAEARYLYISPTDYNFSNSFGSNTASLHMAGVAVTGNIGFRFSN